MSAFYQKWLVIWCEAVALFGIVLAGAAFEATSAPAVMIYELVGGKGVLSLADPVMRFNMALLGAVTMGWSVTLYAAIKAATMLEGAASAQVWRLITLSAAVWYVTDCALSLATGFPLNALSNSVFVVAYLIPVLRSGVLKA